MTRGHRSLGVKLSTSALYQAKWFETVKSSRIRSRVFYDLQPPSTQPFDTRAAHTPSRALGFTPSPAFVRGSPPVRHSGSGLAGIASEWPTTREGARRVNLSAFIGANVEIKSTQSPSNPGVLRRIGPYRALRKGTNDWTCSDPSPAPY
jgi:hypothetical protein